MRTEVEEFSFLPAAQYPSKREAPNSGSDLYWTSSSVIEHTPFERPAVDIPRPACKRAVDESHPKEAKYHSRENATPFCHTTHENPDSYASKFHLVKAIEQVRDERRSRAWITTSISQTKPHEIADVATCSRRRESERVPPEIPLENYDGIAC